MKHIKKKYFELILGTKQHFQLRYLPYGFGYDKPLIIFSLFLFTLYLCLPIKNKQVNSDIDYGCHDYGIQFYDLDEPHILPDVLRLSFGKYVKYFDMPWIRKLYTTYYETNKEKSCTIKLKDFSKYHSRLFKYNGVVIFKDNNSVTCQYYREVFIYKYRLFGKFLDISPVQKNILIVEYNGGKIDKIESFENESCKDTFIRYCNEQIKKETI